jgi:hypothetical protein
MRLNEFRIVTVVIDTIYKLRKEFVVLRRGSKKPVLEQAIPFYETTFVNH